MIRSILIVLFNLADLFFTRFWIKNYGIEIEGNMFGRWILQTTTRQILFKVVIPSILTMLLFILRKYNAANIALWAILAVYAMLFIYHIVLFCTIGGIKK